MASTSRTSQVISNSIYGIVASLINVVLNLVVRLIIVHYLGDQINGLHSLFISTISILALVETGFTTAMIIHLYEPVLHKNVTLISQLMKFYKSVYYKIAFGFIGLGIIVDVFFIDRIITTTIDMWTVRFYFLLFVISFFVNYLTFYKRSLLFAEQKNRVSVMATTASELVFRGIAIIIVVTTHHYSLFLICLIFERWFSNFLCARYVDKYFPFLKHIHSQPLAEHVRCSIFRTVKPLMINQVSSTIQRASNSVLISALLGNVAIVGYYGSYQLITSTVELLLGQLGGAFTSSFGNLAAEKNVDSMRYNYLKASFIMCFISSLACVVIMSCVQDVVLLLFGVNFILPMSVVLLIVGSSFIGLINLPVISVQNAMGLHRVDASWMAIQAIVAILLGYIGGKYFGMNGILIGLVVPTILLTSIRKGVMINRISFNVGWLPYLKQIGWEMCKCGIAVSVILWVCQNIAIDNIWLSILVKAVIGLLVGICIMSLLSIRNPFFLEYAEIIKSKILKKS